MINIHKLQSCTACGACKNVCPKGAISFIADESGFFYPIIDEIKCIDCSLCDGVCQIQNSVQNEQEFQQKFYALVNKNENLLKKSSSGGAFLSIAEYVFRKDGVVVGCAFDEELKACHIVTYDLEECIEKLCGSKYVQSDIGLIYSKVKDILSTERLVLFTGTSCQIEGLYLYLKKKPKNLITIDLICHGVSSPLLWEKHKKYLERRVKERIKKYRFRGKEKEGWALYYYYYYYGDKNRCKKGPSLLDRYYTDFLKGTNYREACYICKYANLNRVGDFTIGDFWGVEKYFPFLDKHKGVSLVLVNTCKAEKLLDCIKDNVFLYETTMENATAYNPNLLRPTTRPNNRDEYYKNVFTDFNQWEQSFTKTKTYKVAKFKSKIPRFIKKWLRR